MDEIKTWWFSKKIEDFPREELMKRMKKVMDLDFKSKIVLLPYLGIEEIVEYKTNELIGLCPATGYPDFYTLSLKYIPDTLIPELKSYKFYLMSYLDIPISHEHLADKIYSDFKEVVKPKKLYLHLKVASRGGIITEITRGKI